MTFEHIGYAVNDIEKAIKQMSVLGWNFEEIIEDADRGVNLCFGVFDNSRVELVSPIEKGKSSVIDLQLSKIGPTPYHICYKSENLDEEIENLRKNRFKVLLPPAKAVAFEGKRVVFMYSLAIGMIEIVEA